MLFLRRKCFKVNQSLFIICKNLIRIARKVLEEHFAFKYNHQKHQVRFLASPIPHTLHHHHMIGLDNMIITIPNESIKHDSDIQAIIEHVKRNWHYTNIITTKKPDCVEILVVHAKTKGSE